MMIRKSLGFILGLMLAAFVVSGTATAITITPGSPGFGTGSATSLSLGDALQTIISADDEEDDVAGSAVFEFDPQQALTGVGNTSLSPLTSGFEGLSITWAADSGGGGEYDSDDISSGIVVFGSIIIPSIFASVLSTDSLFLIVKWTGVSEPGSITLNVSAVPLPAAGILFGSALAGIGFLSRRRRKKLNTHAVI